MPNLGDPAFREALSIIGILLNVIIGLLLYIFQQQNAKTKEDVTALKTDVERRENDARAERARLEASIREHEADERKDLEKIDAALSGLRQAIGDLHVTLPSEYVKQTVLAAMQLDFKADMSKVFTKMDELKDMMISMGADRRAR